MSNLIKRGFLLELLYLILNTIIKNFNIKTFLIYFIISCYVLAYYFVKLKII